MFSHDPPTHRICHPRPARTLVRRGPVRGAGGVNRVDFPEFSTDPNGVLPDPLLPFFVDVDLTLQ